MGIGIPLVIVVFYLYLLVRPRHVKGPLAFRIGLLGVCVIAFSQFLAMGSGGPSRIKTAVVLQAIGSMVSLIAAMYSCRVPPLIAALEPKPPKAQGPDDADAEA